MSELIVNTISGLSDLSVGNTTVNSTVNSTSFSTGNTNITGDTLSVGNSTVNTAITSTGFTQNGDNISPVQSFRNKIINGNFDFWQRGTSTSTGGYLSDRWRTNVTGSTFTSSRQAFTLGQTDVPNEPSYFHRVVVTSVAGASNYCILYQPIESLRTFAGQTATLSFWAKADASKNMAVDFAQYFGSGGSPSSSVTGIGVTTCALTTSWQKFTITVSVPSISGKTLGTDNNDWFGPNFWFDAGSDYNSRTNSLGQQSGTFDIAQVQLEVGSIATPFEVRPPGVELSLCQRYYQQIGNLGTSLNAMSFKGYNAASAYDLFTLPTIVQMRTSPTVSAVGTWTTTNCGQPSTVGSSPTSIAFQVQITALGQYVLTSNNSGHFTAEAEL